MSTTVERLRAQLKKAHADLETASMAAQTSAARANALTIDDPGALSGIRRKPNRRADDRRYSMYERAAAAQKWLDRAQGDVDRLTRALQAAEAEAERVPLTADDARGATHVRDKNGWHKVVTVNRTTVTVETGYSWTDRIPLERVLEARVFA